VVLGYLNNDKATKETFEDGWMRTGDEAVFRKGPKGTEHVFIVDRIKELIKVKVCFPYVIPEFEIPANIRNRVYKSHPPSWKPTSSPTPP
jgi:hypothetical protein